MSIRFNPPFRLRHVFSTKSIAPNREHAVFSERTPEVYTNLSCWRFVFYWERITAIDSLLSPLRGNACGVSKRAFGLFSRVCRIRFDPPFRLRPIFSSKSIAPNREPAVFSERTPGVYTNLSCWRFVFYSITDNGDSRVCQIRFNPPFRLRHVFSSKSIAPNREPLVFRTELRKY